MIFPRLKKQIFTTLLFIVSFNSFFFSFSILADTQQNTSQSYQSFVQFFKQWRSFENPPMIEGVPDYTEKMFNQRYQQFVKLKQQLNQFKIENWNRSEKVDWHIVRAEMNGYDFNHRVLKPWVRDPAFYKTVWTYQSDVPAHEGPTHHALVELWQYKFPLNQSMQNKLAKELSVIPALNKQAKKNLTGNAKELWVAGIRDIKEQGLVLKKLLSRVKIYQNSSLNNSIEKARVSTDEFVQWLVKESKNKTGKSGIGKDNYTWYQQNVHLVPLTWEQEVTLLKRELDRAWSSLKLEEHRNRNLPPLISVKNAKGYDALAERSARKFIDFLKAQDIVTVADYFEPALRQHLGSFIPEKTRHFFYIASHFDPTPLYSHFYHWFEIAKMQHEPHTSVIRREPLLYNIFDSHNEGLATGVEEIFMQAGLYDDNPRVRELVWIMLAQRAARGLGSLYAHANMMSMQEAGKIHMNWTPRGWMKTEPDLLIFEQHLYLRQPGYGTSYVTGKYLIERTMADYAKMKEDNNKPFSLKQFMDEFTAIGSIPTSLGRWEMTGLTDEIDKLGHQQLPD